MIGDVGNDKENAREAGFYWAQVLNNDPRRWWTQPSNYIPGSWTIAAWDGIEWQMIGWEEGAGPLKDSDWQAIEERRIERCTETA